MNKLGKVAVALAMAFSIGVAGAADTLLEYLTCTGAQYIDTGVRPNKTTHAVIKQRTTDTGTDKMTFGVRNAGYGFLCWFGRNPGTKVNPCIGTSGNKGDKNTGFSSGDIWTLDFSLDGVLAIGEVSGEVVTNTAYAASALAGHSTDAVSSKTLALFGLNDNGSIDGRKYVGDCFSFQLYDGGKLVRDLVPCKKDGVVCMYNQAYDAADPATGEKYYMSKTSTAFVAGPELSNGDVLVVSGLPDDYGDVKPGYGRKTGIAVGESFVCTAPACCTNAEVVAECRGYVVYTNGVEYVSGAENSFEYTHPDCVDGAELAWQWGPTHYKLDIDVVGGGTVDVESQFVTSGGVVTVTATPNAGMKFWKWTGPGVTAAERYRASVDITLTEARALTANFYDPATTPRIVRYVKTAAAGKKDGTSWADAMSSVATAYASVGANPGGGEVWLLKGRHNCNSTITMLPNVVIRGGFAGTETSADEADPKANPTIIAHGSYNSGTDTWQYGTPTMWTGEDLMTFVEPEVGDNTPVFGYDYRGSGKLFNNTDGADLGESGLYGLWFHAYSIHVIQMTSANAKPFVIKNCRFTASGWYMHNTDKTINAIDAAVDIEDCEFIGCANTVYLTTSSKNSPVTTNIVKGCRFYTCDWNWNCSPVAAGVAACNNAKLILRDSVFDKCRNSSNGGDTRSGAVLLYGTQDALVENCVFRRSMTTTGSRAAAVTITPQTNTFVATFNRCRFEGNTYSGSGCGAHNSVGSAIGATGTGRLYVNDSLFVGNVVTNAAYDNPAASCVGLTGTWNGAFANCTFEDNVAIDTAGRTLRYTFTTSWTASRYFAFANCVFNNNICGYSKTDVPFKRQAEFRKPDQANEGQTYSFVNCVFANAAEDYKMFVEGESMSWGDDLAFANCVTSSTNSWGKATSKTFRYEPLDNATLAPLKDYTETNGVTVARGIAETSVYRKKGRPVYRAANGDLYIYDTVFNAAKPWRLLRSPGTVYTPEEGAAKGLSPRGEPIADAFGEPRSKIKGALGPIDWPLPGMMLLVR